MSASKQPPTASVDTNALENVYDASRSDTIKISDDKLWRYLKDYEVPVKLVAVLTSSFTIGLTFIATVLSLPSEESALQGNEHVFIFDVGTWKLLFAVGFVAALIVFGITSIRAIYLCLAKKWITTERIIAKIKREAKKIQ